MRKFLSAIAGAALAALAFVAPASAQAVTQMPAYVDRDAVTDFGNGPLRFQGLTGQASIFSASTSGTGTSAGTTALTLSASAAANPPCVGCAISCVGGALAPSCSIPAGTTVTAFNGTTGITTSVATTVTAATVNFGTACPSAANAIAAGVKPALIGPGVNLPFWTTARLCGVAQGGQSGASLAVSSVNTVQ